MNREQIVNKQELLNAMIRQRKENQRLKSKGFKVIIECPVKDCKKEFAQFNSLQKHLRVHTGDRPYSCTHKGCGKSFTQISNLKRHTKIHTGEKPHQCKVCLKRFGTLSNCQQHESVHYSKECREVFACPEQSCNKTYFYRCSLNKHVLQSHGKDSKNMKLTKQKIKKTFKKAMKAKKVTKKTKKQKKQSRISLIKSIVEQRMQDHIKEQVKEKTQSLKSLPSVNQINQHEENEEHFTYGQDCKQYFNLFEEPVKEETSASTRSSSNTSFLFEEEFFQQPQNVCGKITSLFDNDDQLYCKRKFTHLFSYDDIEQYDIEPQMMKKVDDEPNFNQLLESVQDEELKSIENFLDEQEIVSQSTISESPIIPFKLETVAQTNQPSVYNFFPQKERMTMSQFDSCFDVYQQIDSHNLFQQKQIVPQILF